MLKEAKRLSGCVMIIVSIQEEKESDTVIK